MKLTKTMTETCDYYQAGDGTEYRVVARSQSQGKALGLRLEVLTSGEWLPVSDADTKCALLDTWVRS
jgi:hypothetical protein